MSVYRLRISACAAPLTVERQEWRRPKSVFSALPVLKRATAAQILAKLEEIITTKPRRGARLWLLRRRCGSS